MINKKLVETPVKMMNRMEEITDLICEYNDEVQKQQEEIKRLNNIINELDDKKDKEIERLHSIIKEVRECVETAISEDYYDGEIYKIKKILDKENI